MVTIVFKKSLINLFVYYWNNEQFDLDMLNHMYGEGNSTPLQYLAWKIPWMEEPGRRQSMGHWGSDTTEQLHVHFSLSCIGEGNGNPLQCSCLENPRNGEAWWAAVCGVAQSRTRLKWLSSSSNHMYIIVGILSCTLYIVLVETACSGAIVLVLNLCSTTY